MLTRKGLVLIKDQLDATEIVSIRKKLTVTVPPAHNAPMGAQQPVTFKIYLENQGKLCIPRHYGFSQLKLARDSSGNLDISPILESSTRCPNLQFAGSLNKSKHQDIAFSAAMDAFKCNGGGILSLPTGFGKTVVGIALMCALGLKTVIVVHKDFLVEQWIERIKHFCPLARIGVIRQSKTDVQDKDVVIAMLQSLSLKEYSQDVFSDFGFAIYDEVHHLSAPVFSRALFKLNCPYTLGLSATPTRKDGLTWVIESFIGPMFFQLNRKHQTHVNVEVVTLPFTSTIQRCPYRNTINYNEVLNSIVSDTQRNECIQKIVQDCVKESQRRILILTDRRVHCTTLHQLMSSFTSAFIYYGGMPSSVIERNKACKVMISTFSFVNEGLDIPDLNTVMLTTPKGDIIQAVGRILREGSIETRAGPCPLIIDIVDDHTYFKNKFRERRAYYNKAGFTIDKSKEKRNMTRNLEVVDVVPDEKDNGEKSPHAFAFHDDE